MDTILQLTDMGVVKPLETLPFVVFFIVSHFICQCTFPAMFPEQARRLSPDLQAQWLQAMISFLHAITVAPSSLYLAFQYPWLQFDDFYSYNTNHAMLGNLMLGFFVFDTTLYIRHRNWPEWSTYMMHHSLGLLSLTVFSKQYLVQSVIITLGLMEFSNLMVNVRWFLSTAGLKDKYPLLNMINGIIGTLLYFIMRICLFGYVGYCVMIKQSANFLSLNYFHQSVIVLCFVPAYLLQWFWFYKVMRGIIKVVTKYSTKGKAA
eukprot:m.89982 g.89982  ORF g.89982 m.89982 type:complete len:262 (+) comp13250_c0_seq1:63-848(+)